MVVPKEGSRSGLLLTDLHRKVSQVESGLLKESADDSEPDFNEAEMMRNVMIVYR